MARGPVMPMSDNDRGWQHPVYSKKIRQDDEYESSAGLIYFINEIPMVYATRPDGRTSAWAFLSWSWDSNRQ